MDELGSANSSKGQQVVGLEVYKAIVPKDK